MPIAMTKTDVRSINSLTTEFLGSLDKEMVGDNGPIVGREYVLIEVGGLDYRIVTMNGKLGRMAGEARFIHDVHGPIEEAVTAWVTKKSESLDKPLTAATIMRTANEIYKSLKYRDEIHAVTQSVVSGNERVEVLNGIFLSLNHVDVFHEPIKNVYLIRVDRELINLDAKEGIDLLAEVTGLAASDSKVGDLRSMLRRKALENRVRAVPFMTVKGEFSYIATESLIYKIERGSENPPDTTMRNGDDGIWFKNPIPDFDYNPMRTMNEFFEEFDPMFPEPKIMAARLGIAWVFQNLLMETPERFIWMVIGNERTGKTTLVNTFLQLVGGPTEQVFTKLGKKDPEGDLAAIMANAHLTGFDEAVAMFKLYGDILATYAMGGTKPNRKLYTDDDLFKSVAQSALAFTGHNLQFDTRGTDERMMVTEYVERPSDGIGQKAMKAWAVNHRNLFMSGVINFLTGFKPLPTDMLVTTMPDAEQAVRAVGLDPISLIKIRNNLLIEGDRRISSIVDAITEAGANRPFVSNDDIWDALGTREKTMFKGRKSFASFLAKNLNPVSSLLECPLKAGRQDGHGKRGYRFVMKDGRKEPRKLLERPTPQPGVEFIPSSRFADPADSQPIRSADRSGVKRRKKLS